jgi:hypothetical protein
MMMSKLKGNRSCNHLLLAKLSLKMQQACKMGPWYVIQDQRLWQASDGTPKFMQEDQSSFQHVANRKLQPLQATATCTPCPKCSHISSSQLAQDARSKDEWELHSQARMDGAKRTKSNGLGAQTPSLVDGLPQTFIHKTTDYYPRRLTGVPKEVCVSKLILADQ